MEDAGCRGQGELAVSVPSSVISNAYLFAQPIRADLLTELLIGLAVLLFAVLEAAFRSE